MTFITDGKSQIEKERNGANLVQSYLDPIWIPILPKLDFIIQKDSRRSGWLVIMFFSHVGSWRHDPPVHQVSRTLEGRKRHEWVVSEE